MARRWESLVKRWNTNQLPVGTWDLSSPPGMIDYWQPHFYYFCTTNVAALCKTRWSKWDWVPAQRQMMCLVSLWMASIPLPLVSFENQLQCRFNIFRISYGCTFLVQTKLTHGINFPFFSRMLCWRWAPNLSNTNARQKTTMNIQWDLREHGERIGTSRQRN